MTGSNIETSLHVHCLKKEGSTYHGQKCLIVLACVAIIVIFYATSRRQKCLNQNSFFFCVDVSLGSLNIIQLRPVMAEHACSTR